MTDAASKAREIVEKLVLTNERLGTPECHICGGNWDDLAGGILHSDEEFICPVPAVTEAIASAISAAVAEERERTADAIKRAMEAIEGGRVTIAETHAVLHVERERAGKLVEAVKQRAKRYREWKFVSVPEDLDAIVEDYEVPHE